jgi:hypothetical protein
MSFCDISNRRGDGGQGSDGDVAEVNTMKRTLQVQVLTFGDCPNRHIAMERLRIALAEENVDADVTEVEIADSTLAQEQRFLGSPSVRINGVDIEPAARSAERFGLMCRTYPTSDGSEGAPPLEMIRAALRMQIPT